MENVILSCDKCRYQGKCYMPDNCKTESTRHLLRILKETCAEHKLPVYSVLGINLPAHRYDCPECLAEIEKEIEK